MKAHYFLWLSFFLVQSACTNSNDSPVDPKPVLLLDQKITVDNRQRNYHLYIPKDPSNAQIVLLMHGNSGSSDQLLGIDGNKAPAKLWLDVALRENLILVIPDGLLGPNNQQGWNDCRFDAPTNPASDDVQFIASLIETVQKRYTNATPKFFAFGISNGALMAMRLADEMPESISALAIIVASRPVNSECTDPNMAIPVLLMNGTSDPILPYAGGQIKSNRGEVYSTPETVDYWVSRNQAEATPSVTTLTDSNQSDDSTVTRFDYKSKLSKTVVAHYEVSGGGHTEPSIAEPYGRLFKLIVGNQNRDIEMVDEVWKFFALTMDNQKSSQN